MKSKSVTNLAEATADPDPAGGPINQIEIHPLLDGPIMNVNGEAGRNLAGLLDLHAAAQNLQQNPPGSPLLRLHLHDAEREPGPPPPPSDEA